MDFLTEIFSDYHQPHDGQMINTEAIASVVFLNEPDAARVFNMGTTRFKATCRRVGIKTWPYRRFAALRNLYNDLKKDGLEHIAMMNEIKSFAILIKKDLSLATGPWPENILSIRSKTYKKRHKKIISTDLGKKPKTNRQIMEKISTGEITLRKNKGVEGGEDIHDVCLDYLLHHNCDMVYDLFSQNETIL